MGLLGEEEGGGEEGIALPRYRPERKHFFSLLFFNPFFSSHISAQGERLVVVSLRLLMLLFQYMYVHTYNTGYFFYIVFKGSVGSTKLTSINDLAKDLNLRS